MNFKFIIAFFAVLLLINNVLAAKDVAYIVKSSSEIKVISAFNDLGYSYDVITDNLIPLTDFSQYAIIFIQDSINNKDKLPLDTKNSVFLTKDLLAYEWTTGSVISGDSSTFTANFNPAEFGTSFSKGFTSLNFNAYTTGSPISYIHVFPSYVHSVVDTTGSTGVKSIVAYSEDSVRKVFFGFYSTDYWSENTKRLFENTLNWTRLGMDFDGDSYYSGTDCNDNDATKWHYLNGFVDADKDGKGIGSLVKICAGNTLPLGYSNINGDCNDTDANKYQLLPGYVDNDFDGKGIGNITQVCSGSMLGPGYSNAGTDCNDTNTNVWRNMPGYLDKDKDRVGVGNILQVCSGTNLTAGYANTAGDCNDNNATISPIINDTPYDGIDQNCDGYDLGDVDGDGYCNQGYLINASLQCPKDTGLFGTDCNDNNAIVNSDGNDIYSDCKNDPPFIENISKIKVEEGEKIIVTIKASDPENDSLSYTINDPRFIQSSNNKNIFTWITSYNDRGNYVFKVTVNDGRLATVANFNVEVGNKNRAPKCKEIPDISLMQEQKINISLNNYCSDEDNDTLTYNILAENSSHISVQINKGIATITNEKYWYGEDWIKFNVSDGTDSVETNEVRLKVIHVNQAPSLSKNIEEVSLVQDTNSSDKIDLNDYFNDADSNMTFSVSGNNMIGIEINNGKVSFYPKNSFSGKETVIFSANDEEFTAHSDSVILNVIHPNQAPQFGQLNCLANINEDEENSCDLSASDFEGDSVTFSIFSRNKLNCNVNGNTLKYISEKDYNGTASCTIRVKDINGGYSDKIFSVYIYNINDAPVIESYYPEQNARVPENLLRVFNVFAKDPDSILETKWFVGNTSAGNGTSYSFKQNIGEYNILAIVSDGDYEAAQQWKINVRPVNEFSCSEADGDICNKDQTCSGEILGVYDSDSCCSVACSQKPPEFKDIRKLNYNQTDDIKIIVDKPALNGTVYLREPVNVTFRVKNLKSEEISADVEAYIYDITKEKIIEKSRSSLIFGNGEERNINFSMALGDDLREKDNYYLFVRVVGKGEDKYKFYNEMYYQLNLTRKDADIEINDIIFNSEKIICGDEVNLTAFVQNYGKKYQNINVQFESSDLDIDEISENFRVESYKEDEEAKGSVAVKIPEDTEEGVYKIIASVILEDKTSTFEKEIEIGKCEPRNPVTSVQAIKINPSKGNEVSSALTSSKKQNSRKNVFVIISIISVILLAVVLFLLVAYNRIINRNVVFD